MPTKKTVKKSVKRPVKRQSKQTNIQKQVSFVDAIRAYWAGYVKFDGVSSRAQYWWAILFVILVDIVFNIIGFKDLSILVSIIFFLPSRALAFRRFHDVGLSGWWNLGPALFFMIWACVRVGSWLFMLSLEWIPEDLKVFSLLAIIWSIFNFIVVVQPSKLQNNKYRK